MNKSEDGKAPDVDRRSTIGMLCDTIRQIPLPSPIKKNIQGLDKDKKTNAGSQHGIKGLVSKLECGGSKQCQFGPVAELQMTGSALGVRILLISLCVRNASGAWPVLRNGCQQCKNGT